MSDLFIVLEPLFSSQKYDFILLICIIRNKDIITHKDLTIYEPLRYFGFIVQTESRELV